MKFISIFLLAAGVALSGCGPKQESDQLIPNSEPKPEMIENSSRDTKQQNSNSSESEDELPEVSKPDEDDLLSEDAVSDEKSPPQVAELDVVVEVSCENNTFNLKIDDGKSGQVLVPSPCEQITLSCVKTASLFPEPLKSSIDPNDYSLLAKSSNSSAAIGGYPVNTCDALRLKVQKELDLEKAN